MATRVASIMNKLLGTLQVGLISTWQRDVYKLEQPLVPHVLDSSGLYKPAPLTKTSSNWLFTTLWSAWQRQLWLHYPNKRQTAPGDMQQVQLCTAWETYKKYTTASPFKMGWHLQYLGQLSLSLAVCVHDSKGSITLLSIWLMTTS